MTDEHTPSTLGRLGVVAAAVLFSTGGAGIKACSLGPAQIACFRSGVAALALLVLFPQARRGFGWRTLVAGAAYASTVISFVLATKLTTAANAIFFQMAAPLYLMLLGPALLREPLRRRDVLLALPMLVGLVLLLSSATSPARTASNPVLGNWIGLGSGFAWALTLIALRGLGKAAEAGTNPALSAVILGNVEACLLCLPWALPVGSGVSRGDLGIIVYLGVVQIGLAYVLLTRSMRHVPVLQASLLLFAEPMLNPVWAWLAHGEQPGPLALAGGVVILAATVAQTLAGTREPAPSPD